MSLLINASSACGTTRATTDVAGTTLFRTRTAVTKCINALFKPSTLNTFTCIRYFRRHCCCRIPRSICHGRKTTQFLSTLTFEYAMTCFKDRLDVRVLSLNYLCKYKVQRCIQLLFDTLLLISDVHESSRIFAHRPVSSISTHLMSFLNSFTISHLIIIIYLFAYLHTYYSR